MAITEWALLSSGGCVLESELATSAIDCSSLQCTMTIPQIVGVLRKVIPVILAVDMVHNFYYVGCMIQEKRQRYQERAHRELAVNVGAAICQVGCSGDLTCYVPVMVRKVLYLPPFSNDKHHRTFFTCDKSVELVMADWVLRLLL